jgi:hypothetical protein
MGNNCFTAQDEDPVFTKLPSHTSEKKSSVGQIDWSSESSVRHRSAINCLHNYAIGKISEANQKVDNKELLDADDPKSHPNKHKLQTCQLRFSQHLEQEYVIDREYLSLDAGRNSDDPQIPLEAFFEQSSPSDVSSPLMEAVEREDCCQDRDIIAERKRSSKACNRGQRGSADFSKAWERSNFMESAPEFGMDQLFSGIDTKGGGSQGS